MEVIVNLLGVLVQWGDVVEFSEYFGCLVGCFAVLIVGLWCCVVLQYYLAYYALVGLIVDIKKSYSNRCYNWARIDISQLKIHQYPDLIQLPCLSKSQPV